MKRIILTIAAILILFSIGILYKLNSVEDIDTIRILDISQTNDSIEMRILESAYYIKNVDYQLCKTEDTANIKISKILVYSINFSKMSDRTKFKKDEKLKYINICNKVINIDSIKIK